MKSEQARDGMPICVPANMTTQRKDTAHPRNEENEQRRYMSNAEGPAKACEDVPRDRSREQVPACASSSTITHAQMPLHTAHAQSVSLEDLQRYLYSRREVKAVSMEEVKRRKEKRKRGFWCETCKYEHLSPCSLHGSTSNQGKSRTSSDDQESKQTYAFESFPDEVQLCSSSIPGVEYGVCAKCRVPRGTWIGPYEGVKVKPDDVTPGSDAGYMWEVFHESRLAFYLDGSDENSSSWMRFIRCARNKEEQNLYAFQYMGNIYYRAFKDIPPGTEMLVWYDETYPQFMGIPLGIRETGNAAKKSEVQDSKVVVVVAPNGTPFTATSSSMPTSVTQSRAPTHVFPSHPGYSRLHTGHFGQYPGHPTPYSGASSSHFGSFSSQTPITSTITRHQSTDFQPIGNRHEAMDLQPIRNHHEATKFQPIGNHYVNNIPGALPRLPHAPADQMVRSLGGNVIPVLPWQHVSSADSQAGNASNKEARHHRSSFPGARGRMDDEDADDEDNGEEDVASYRIPLPASLADQKESDSEKSDGDKDEIFRCGQCNTTFNQRSSLHIHVCPFIPNKPYHCGHCNQPFSDPNELRTHAIVHSSEKPFRCGYCSRAFSGATTLNNHIRTHTGEKPFMCEACGKTFSQASQLSRHQKIPGDCVLSP